jgi:hypothetical protein
MRSSDELSIASRVRWQNGGLVGRVRLAEGLLETPPLVELSRPGEFGE